MKKWYLENYFSRRNWIMENISILKLTPTQVLLLLMIDYDNEFSIPITIETLAQQCNLKSSEVDNQAVKLCEKGYLTISSKRNKIQYDLTGLFEYQNNEQKKELFSIIEEEFGRPLSQKEAVQIAQWVEKYDEKKIMHGLKEAVKYNKKSVEYIDRILSNEGNND